MSLTHDQLIRILSPYWCAEMVALHEIETAREALPPGDYQGLRDLLAMEEMIRHRARHFTVAGLSTAVEHSRGKYLLWPNLYPAPGDQERVVRDLLEKRPAMKAAFERRMLNESARLEAALRQYDATRKTPEPRLEMSA